MVMKLDAIGLSKIENPNNVLVGEEEACVYTLDSARLQGFADC
jgi:hypothetical protein